MTMMGPWRSALIFVAILTSYSSANDNASTSHQVLPSSFKPPPVFNNVHLMRHTNLEKGYVKETINIVIENNDKEPQDQYFLPFTANTISKVGGLEVRDKKAPEKPAFFAELVEYDPYR